MAAKSTRQIKKKGPLLSAAFFCEHVLEDKSDSALSAIRIIDLMTYQLDASTPSDFPSLTNRLPIQIAALVSLKSADSPGDHELRLVMESPSGKKTVIWEKVVKLSDSPHGGFNLKLNNNFAIVAGGLFWLHVHVDGKKMASAPLQINIARIAAPPPQESKSDG